MPRRRNWLDKVNPARWLRNLIPTPKTQRRRGSKDFGEGKKREPRPLFPGAPEFGARQPFGADQPFGPRQEATDAQGRDMWQDAGRPGTFSREWEFFKALPAEYESADEELETWRSFTEHMITPVPGEKFNDPGNPFWSQIGMSPRDFDWQAWRAAGNGRDTP